MHTNLSTAKKKNKQVWEMIPHASVLSIVAGEVGDEVGFARKGCCWAWERGLRLMCLKHNS